jgi:hypothetical protein
MELEFVKLDDEWITNFEKTDKLYQDFYKDDLYYTNLQVIYINRSNEIEKIKQESFLMTTPNYISREEIFQILKKNSTDNERTYKLLTILKYNITLDADDIKVFLKNSNNESSNESNNESSNESNNDSSNDNFLSVVKNIDAIPFEKTINMLQDLNDLIFIFYEKSSELKNKNPNNITKKLHLNPNTKKNTIKKQYKD